MLYVTTRNNQDPVTPYHALTKDRGLDGGLFLPFSAPSLTLEGRSFSERMANTLNVLLQTELTSWDLDFSIGRRPIQLKALGQKIIMAECFHNPSWRFEEMRKTIIRQLSPAGEADGNWRNLAVRLAVLAGILGELPLNPGDTVDMCMIGGDFSGPMAAWYGRKWGLPIGSIVCCCNENKNAWDLIVQGQLRTDAVAVRTCVPEADVSLPEDLERLIYEAGGTEEVNRYLEACRRGGLYTAEDAVLSGFRQDFYVSVVSSHRSMRTIPGVYGTHGYLHSPGSALAFSGLQDYRAKTGIIRPSIILAENSPACDRQTVAEALGVSVQELEAYL